MADWSTATESTAPKERHDEEPPNGEVAQAAPRLDEYLAPIPPRNESAGVVPAPSLPGTNGTKGVSPDHKEVCVKSEPDYEELQEEKEEGKTKEEFGISACAVGGPSNNEAIEDSPLVGKVKIKPIASLVDSNPPNPQPEVHPFFAGFDDHIRSLINRTQPQFNMDLSLLHRPARFMYYDNSTNMNLKSLLNGNKSLIVPTMRPAYRPYVPINIPRPPRSHVPMKTSFSTQTQPVLKGVSNMSGVLGPSYSGFPQNKTPVVMPIPDLAPKSNVATQNFTSQGKLPVWNNSVPVNFYFQHSTAPGQCSTAVPQVTAGTAVQAQNQALGSGLQDGSVHNLAPFSNPIQHLALPSMKVSSSSSTDDLENHSIDEKPIKTEIDLGIDCKEGLLSTIDEEYHLGSHFMDSSQPNAMETNADSGRSVASIDMQSEPSNILLTGDVAIPPVKDPVKRNKEYDLPSYSTKGRLLCKCCDYRTNKNKAMKDHLETMHTAENNFKCFLCIKNLRLMSVHLSLFELEHHVGKVHRGEKRWQCKTCSKSYKCQVSFKAHTSKICRQEHPYACHMCTYTCKTQAGLEKHLRHHEKVQETEQCPFCNKVIKKLYIKKHLLSVHAPDEEKPFHCKKCDFACATQVALDKHFRKTGHNKRFKCDQCAYACNIEKCLVSHIETTHKKVKSGMICGMDGCTLRFMSEGRLKTHRLIHTLPESEVLFCPDKECGKKYVSEAALKYHVNKTYHHRPFKCTDCSLRFLKEESLNKHIQSVHVQEILKKMETPSKGPLCVKNVVDVYNNVGNGNENSKLEPVVEERDEDSVTNFGCWLGISGFADVSNDTECNDQDLPKAGSKKVSSSQEMDEEEGEEGTEDSKYQHVVPVSCLVECEQDLSDGLPADSVGKPDNQETLVLKKEEGTYEYDTVDKLEEEEDDDMDNSDYLHVHPEISCLVECQEDLPKIQSNDSDDEQNKIDYLQTNTVKLELDEIGPSTYEQ